MNVRFIWLGALALAAAFPPFTQAAPPPPCPLPPAPDACGPGYYTPHPCGMVYGPNYNLVPPWPPFQGLLPAPKPPGGGGCYCPPMFFPTHPYARGPRDFFMLE